LGGIRDYGYFGSNSFVPLTGIMSVMFIEEEINMTELRLPYEV